MKLLGNIWAIIWKGEKKKEHCKREVGDIFVKKAKVDEKI